MRHFTTFMIFMLLFSFHMIFSNNDAGTSAELWYNDSMLHRIRLNSDYIRPVSSSAETDTTVIVPEIENGLLVLKIYHY